MRRRGGRCVGRRGRAKASQQRARRTQASDNASSSMPPAAFRPIRHTGRIRLPGRVRGGCTRTVTWQIVHQRPDPIPLTSYSSSSSPMAPALPTRSLPARPPELGPADRELEVSSRSDTDWRLSFVDVWPSVVRCPRSSPVSAALAWNLSAEIPPFVRALANDPPDERDTSRALSTCCMRESPGRGGLRTLNDMADAALELWNRSRSELPAYARLRSKS